MRTLTSLLLFLSLFLGTDLMAQNTTVCSATAQAADAGKTEVEFHIDPGSINSVTKVEMWKPIRGHRDGGVWDPVTPTTVIDDDKVTVTLPRKAVAGDRYRVTLDTSNEVRSYNSTFK
ncbi:MAG: hypothetical protein KDC98_18750 [Planctomycetes bacterium]|nr:hypothetical protein [Planctomycetota bacterium]